MLLAASAGVASAQVRVDPLADLEGETSDPVLSPDGKTLAFDWWKPDYSVGIYTRPFVGGDVKLLADKDNNEGSPAGPAWSPDGKRIAFTRTYSHYDNHLFLKDFASGAERDLGLICDRSTDISWSPDSRYLAASEYREDPPQTFDCRPVMFSVESGARVRRLAPDGTEPALSPDGRLLAYADGGALKLLHLDAGYNPVGPAVVLARELRDITQICWTADARTIIYQALGDVPYLRRIRLATGSHPEAIPDLTTNLSVSQILKDGYTLATETIINEGLWRIDLHSSAPKFERVENPSCAEGAPGCSPDGRSRLFISTRTGLSQIWLSNADGADQRPLVTSIPGFRDPPAHGVPAHVGWSPDDRWIAFSVSSDNGNADLRSSLYVVPSSGGLPRRLGTEAYSLGNPVWSKDGSLYAIRSWQYDDPLHRGQWRIVGVSVPDGRLAPTAALGIAPKVSPDGTFLYFFTHPGFKLARIPIAGGTEERLADQEQFLWTAYTVGTRFLNLFRMPSRGPAYTLIRFDPISRQAVTVTELPFRPKSAHLSPDERFLYVEQQGDARRRMVLVHGLL